MQLRSLLLVLGAHASYAQQFASDVGNMGNEKGQLYVSGKERLLGGALGLACVAWRKSGNCDPSGPRDMMEDKECTTSISGLEAGFCECDGGFQTAALPCGHRPINCQNECGQVSRGYAAPYIDVVASATGKQLEQTSRDGDLEHWQHEAEASVEQAILSSKAGMAEAKWLMDSIHRAPPWQRPYDVGSRLIKANPELRKLAQQSVPDVDNLDVQRSLRELRSRGLRGTTTATSLIGVSKKASL